MLRSFGDRCNGYVTHVGVIHVFAPVGFYLVQALRFVDIFFFWLEISTAMCTVKSDCTDFLVTSENDTEEIMCEK